jgi:hypothetical protein
MIRMRKTLTSLLPSLVLLFALSGCGEGENIVVAGGGGGISGTGSASGQIIGFGSVIVNGIKFTRKTGLADDRVKLGFENITSAGEESLRLGMIVTVRGAFDSATGIGEYESIEFQPEVRGPLDNNGVDLVGNRISIMGRDVMVEANTTFENITDIAGIKGELDAGRHPELEISGNLDNNGALHATRIARKAPDFINGRVEIKGAIASGAIANGFSIGTRAIVVDTTTVFRNMARSDITTGLLVEVKGILNGGILTATRVEKKKAVDAEVNDDVRVKGIAAGGLVGNTFTLNGPNGAITVDTASASFLKGGAAATSTIVAAGATLQVEGSLGSDGAIAASRVFIEVEKTVKLEGNLAAAADIDEVAGTIRLNGITVSVIGVTKLLDDSTLITNLAAFKSALATGSQHLQIAGFLDNGTGKVNASQVQRTAAPSKLITFIQGPVDLLDAAAQTLTILGITVNTAAIVQAGEFVDNRFGLKAPFDAALAASRTKFFAAVTSEGVGLAVVKAKGAISGAVLSATEVELEQPL